MQIPLFNKAIAALSVKAAKWSIAFFSLVLICSYGYGQIFYYAESKLHTADNKPLAYHVFLRVAGDGNSASARVAFKDPVTGKSRLVKQNLVYNNFPDDFDKDSIVYFVPFGDAFDENDQPEKNFIIPMFRFDKSKVEYLADAPITVSYSFNNKNWFAPDSGSIVSKSRQDLVSQKALVKQFFREDEDFYKDLYNIPAKYLIPFEEKRSVFVITVAATDDPEIGKTTTTDLQNAEQVFFAAFYPFKFHYTKITGTNFTKNAVNKAIAQLKPGPKDVVIFYYSGHGFRYNEDVSSYPRMALVANANQSPDAANLALEDVYNRILKRGALVTIVLADCCNEKYGAAPPKGPSPLPQGGVPPPPPSLDLNNFRPLFMPAKRIRVIACAAEKDQLAGGNEGLGGFFTHFFTDELSKSVFGPAGDGEASWARMLNNVKEYTRRQALTAPCNEGPCDQGRCLQQPEAEVTNIKAINSQ